MDYKIIVENDSVELEKKVKQDLNQGWQLYGSLNIFKTNESNYLVFIQALTRSY